MARKKKKVKKAKKPAKKTRKTLEGQDSIHRTRMRVMGIGGGGSSIVSEIAPQVQKVDFVVANTDLQALRQAARTMKTFHFGQQLTRSLGCGMDPKIGQKAAKEAKPQISKLFKGVDLCIIVVSLGGGTGSGAAPEFARIARDLKIMTFGIFTLPFKFEGAKKIQIARSSLKKLMPNLNALAIIPNENIFQIVDKKTPIKEAFSTINKRLAANLRGLCEMVYLPGLINIDFADLRTILDGRGKLAYLNSSSAQGGNRTEEALAQVLRSPLNEYNIQGAEKIIFNITASQDLGMREVEQISQAISNFNRRAKIIFGVSQDNSYRDKIRITLLALGCGKNSKPKTRSKPELAPEPEPEPEPEPKPEPQPKPEKKNKKKKLKKTNSSSVPIVIKKEEAPDKALTRRNALDLKKAAEESEEEILAQEKKWDIPAFLRRKEEKKAE